MSGDKLVSKLKYNLGIYSDSRNSMSQGAMFKVLVEKAVELDLTDHLRTLIKYQQDNEIEERYVVGYFNLSSFEKYYDLLSQYYTQNTLIQVVSALLNRYFDLDNRDLYRDFYKDFEGYDELKTKNIFNKFLSNDENVLNHCSKASLNDDDDNSFRFPIEVLYSLKDTLLDHPKNPVTPTNFLVYVLRGSYFDQMAHDTKLIGRASELIKEVVARGADVNTAVKLAYDSHGVVGAWIFSDKLSILEHISVMHFYTLHEKVCDTYKDLFASQSITSISCDEYHKLVEIARSENDTVTAPLHSSEHVQHTEL